MVEPVREVDVRRLEEVDLRRGELVAGELKSRLGR